MSDKEIIEKIEAEARKIKPKVLSSKRSAFSNQKRLSGGGSSGGCGDDCGVILTGYELGGHPGTGADSGFFYYDHYANTYTQLSGATKWRHDIARWDDKLYAKKYTSFAGHNIIQEYQINYANCSLTLLRDIHLEDYTGFDNTNVGGWIDVGNAMDMKDANTIICGTVGSVLYATGAIPTGAPWAGQNLISVDISGATGIATNVGFPASSSSLYPNTCNYKAVDVIYMQDTSQYLVSMSYGGIGTCSNGPNNVLRLFSLSGQLLDECASVAGGLGMYRTGPNDDIYITGPQSSVHLVNFNPLAVGPALQNAGLETINGAAYNSNPNVVCDPPSADCYDIGDTGPEGGIIFAVPLGHPQNNGVNQTNFYYEVANNDIAIAGTPSAGFNSTCGPSTATQQVQVLVQSIGQLGVANITDLYVGISITGPNIAPGSTIISIYPGSGTSGIVQLSSGSIIGGPYTVTDPFSITYQTQGVPGWTASGAEWGVHNKPNITTSTDFGTGHKNTDVIDAYPLSPGSPTGGIHPWLDTHDIAATICKQHPSAKDDWFLPSRDEFIEMVDASNTYGFALGLNGLGQFSEHQYWTSSQYRHDPTLGSPPQFPDKYSWTVKSNGAPGLAYRCHALSVRPIRRFECKPEPDPIDTGITYDYRIDTFGHSCAGTIHKVVNPNISQYTSVTYSVDAYAFSMLNQSTGSGGNFIFNTSDLVLTIDSTTVSSLPNIGGYLNDIGGIPYSQFGPIVDVIDIATHPVLGVNLPIYQNAAGANIDTFIVFNPLSNFSGPNGFFIGQNYSQGTFIDNISYDIQTLNPLWSASVFGSSYEIGHPRLYIAGFNRLDVRMNDVVGLGYNDRIVQRIGEIFNIKIYNQYEELLGDWDYELIDESGGFGCCVSHCYKELEMVRSQTNYVNPLYSSHPDVVDLDVYHEGFAAAGHPDGWAYVAITCVTDPTFNSNFTRGNTLNLENWRGTGQNNRTKDTTYPISGMQWKWQRETCGVNLRGHCCGGTCGRYHAEVNPPLNNIYCNAFNGWTPNHTALFDNKNHCQSGQLDVVGGSVSKLIGPSENYPSEINECFERGIEEVDVHVIPQVSGENTSKRQKFINDKKPKETGPFGIAGYYPLYDTIEAATYNSPTPIESRTGENTYGYHIHDFGGQEYYMPNGLEMGKTQFHGDYDGQVIPETTVQPETIQPEQPSIVTITPIEPEQEEEPPTPTPTYTPPPSTPSSGSGGY